MPSNKGAKRKAGGAVTQPSNEPGEAPPDVEAGARVAAECNAAIKEFARGARWARRSCTGQKEGCRVAARWLALQSAVIGALELTGTPLQAQGEEGAAEAGEGVPPVGPAAPLPGTAAVSRGLDAGIGRDGPTQPATAGAAAGGPQQRGRRQRALPGIAQLYAPPDCCNCLRNARSRLRAALGIAGRAC